MSTWRCGTRSARIAANRRSTSSLSAARASGLGAASAVLHQLLAADPPPRQMRQRAVVSHPVDEASLGAVAAKRGERVPDRDGDLLRQIVLVGRPCLRGDEPAEAGAVLAKDLGEAPSPSRSWRAPRPWGTRSSAPQGARYRWPLHRSRSVSLPPPADITGDREKSSPRGVAPTIRLPPRRPRPRRPRSSREGTTRAGTRPPS